MQVTVAFAEYAPREAPGKKRRLASRVGSAQQELTDASEARLVERFYQAMDSELQSLEIDNQSAASILTDLSLDFYHERVQLEQLAIEDIFRLQESPEMKGRITIWPSLVERDELMNQVQTLIQDNCDETVSCSECYSNHSQSTPQPLMLISAQHDGPMVPPEDIIMVPISSQPSEDPSDCTTTELFTIPSSEAAVDQQEALLVKRFYDAVEWELQSLELDDQSTVTAFTDPSVGYYHDQVQSELGAIESLLQSQQSPGEVQGYLYIQPMLVKHVELIHELKAWHSESTERKIVVSHSTPPGSTGDRPQTKAITAESPDQAQSEPSRATPLAILPLSRLSLYSKSLRRSLVFRPSASFPKLAPYVVAGVSVAGFLLVGRGKNGAGLRHSPTMRR